MVSGLNILTTLAINHRTIPAVIHRTILVINHRTTLATSHLISLAIHNSTTLALNSLTILVVHSQITLVALSQTTLEVPNITIQDILLILILQEIKISTLVISQLTMLDIHKISNLGHLTTQVISITRATKILLTRVQDRNILQKDNLFTPTFLVSSHLCTLIANTSAQTNVPFRATCPPILASQMVERPIPVVNTTQATNITQTNSVPIPTQLINLITGRTTLNLYPQTASTTQVSKTIPITRTPIRINRTSLTILRTLQDRNSSIFTRTSKCQRWNCCVQYPALMELVLEETCVPVKQDMCP